MTDAIMGQVVRLWTATSHTPEQDANKDKQMGLYYQNLKSGHWTITAVAKAFDNLSRDNNFWPSWAKIEAELCHAQADLAPRQIKADPPHLIRRNMAYRAMSTPTGQMALREGWARSYHVSIERDGRSPDLSDRDIERFRAGMSEFKTLFESLDLAIPGTDKAHEIGKKMIQAEQNLRDRFLQT